MSCLMAGKCSSVIVMQNKTTKSRRFKASDIDVEDFLEALEVQNVTDATEEEFKFSCPFPGHSHGDESPSAYMNKETSAWMCHGCKRKGNGITFLSEHENITIMEATRFLHERYGSSGNPDAYSARVELEKLFEKQEREREILEQPQLDEELIDRYWIDWPMVAKSEPIPKWGDYIIDRGFTPKTLTDWDIGYCDDRDRIAIPIRDREGVLIGFKVRAWKEEQKPKYLVLGETRSERWDRYHVSLNVFGLNRAEPDNGELIVVEGELNVIAMWQMGYKNAVAVNGSNFSDSQKRQIASVADRATVFFDSDDSGHKGVRLVLDKLSSAIPVRVVPDHNFDAADCIHPGKEANEADLRSLLDEAESELMIRLRQQTE